MTGDEPETCSLCHLPRPNNYCWQSRIECPFEMPPRDIDLRIWKHLVDQEKRIRALENPPCCKGGPQWGHAWECPKCPD